MGYSQKNNRILGYIIVGTAWMILVFTIFYVNSVSRIEPVPLRQKLLYFPFDIGDWKGKERVQSEFLLSYLGADDGLVRAYKNPSGDEFELYMSYFDYTKQHRAPHAPQLCWIGGGWSFKDLGNREIDTGVKNAPSVIVKRILATKKDTGALLIYSYRTDDRYTIDMSQFRALLVKDSILKKKNNAFTLQLSANMSGDDEDYERKLDEMQSFLRRTFNILESDFFPKN